MKRFSLSRLQVVTHVAALLPLLNLLWDASQQGLGVNPIQTITLRTGKTALVLLILSLAATPASLLGFKQALKIRRPLGLYAFFYALLHLLIYVVLDYGLDWQLLWLELAEKRYVIAGFTAWLLMLPLALPSTRGWQRRLGKRWRTLHRLAYGAGIAAVVHFIWLVKSDIRTPLGFAAVLLVLLLMRRQPIRGWLVRSSRRLRRRWLRRRKQQRTTIDPLHTP